VLNARLLTALLETDDNFNGRSNIKWSSPCKAGIEKKYFQRLKGLPPFFTGGSKMAWYEVSIKTNTAASEAVIDVMNSVGADGCSVEDPNDPIFLDSSEKNWDYLDVSELKFEYDGALVKAYFEVPDGEEFNSAYLVEVAADGLDKLKEAGVDPSPAEVAVQRIYEEDWANEWKKYFKPFRIGKNVVIKPSWEEFEMLPEDLVIEIDPGGAFGSGTHETTSMCIELIEKHMKKGDIVFDIGCGSGILGVAAAKLGASKVIAGDIDTAAVVTSIENAGLNGVSDVMTAREGDLFAVAEGKADLIVANIIADVIIMVSSDVPQFLNEGGTYIASGIIDFRKDEVIDAVRKAGFSVVDVMEKGCWVALAMKSGEVE
jgi:ribosomal protein L11 methyltransferase